MTHQSQPPPRRERQAHLVARHARRLADADCEVLCTTSSFDALHVIEAHFHAICFLAISIRRPTATKLELRDALIGLFTTVYNQAFDSPITQQCNNDLVDLIEARQRAATRSAAGSE